MTEIINHPNASPERPPLFAEAYPAPWRIEDHRILDRDGNRLAEFSCDHDWGEERFFWGGIVHCVNVVGNVFDGLLDEHGRLTDAYQPGELLRRMAAILPALDEGGEQ